ncbi:MAG: hypothetical protein HAW63_00320 [Bdellovibrionaceae bacterium]|nr:hypothetical protein [Pseudobdellovibrionaceae bacterium]
MGSVFIVDPLYTLPFLLTMVLAFFAKQKNAYRWATLGLVLSTGYLLWAFLAQQWVLQRAVTELKKQNIIYQKIFVGPTYFNSFLWRVVVLKKEKYYEGFGSVFDKNLAIHFKSHDRNLKLLTGLEKNSTIKKMKYFSHGFYAVAPNNKKHTLKVMDLRMGWSNHYYFQYRVAQRESKSKRYKPTAPKRVFFRPQLSEIKTVWNRIWKENNF